MSDNVQIIKPTNFIRNQINTDLDSKLHNSIHHTLPARTKWLPSHWPCKINMPQLWHSQRL